jgi:hypothetical protein
MLSFLPVSVVSAGFHAYCKPGVAKKAGKEIRFASNQKNARMNLGVFL